jgi:hypothetical protein
LNVSTRPRPHSGTALLNSTPLRPAAAGWRSDLIEQGGSIQQAFDQPQVAATFLDLPQEIVDGQALVQRATEDAIEQAL